MIITNPQLNLLKILILASTLTVGNFAFAALPTQPTESVLNEKNVWDNSYNKKTKQRFIPVELFTGAYWDGKHQLVMKPVTTVACSSAGGRPCDKYFITGPFKTTDNTTSISWVGDKIPYYKRTFSTRRMGDVVSHFTINNSKDGLVRIFDKRKSWGNRTYSGLGSKFPLGYWRQGEIRHYDSRAPISIEILELNGPDNCLTFRWIIGTGKRRNSDNNYTFCPNRGFTKVSHNYGDSKGKSRTSP